MIKNAVLCYIEGPWAFFTTLPLEEQWGDDWNDAPYEHNAGYPYEPREGESWEIVKIAWDGPFITPDDGVINSRYSVQAINRGDIAWLRPEAWLKLLRPIPAGTTLQEFKDRMISAGGMVYFPWEGMSERYR